MEERCGGGNATRDGRGPPSDDDRSVFSQKNKEGETLSTIEDREDAAAASQRAWIAYLLGVLQ